jgi:hypothetical protein
MDSETTGTENALSERQAARRLGRSPQTVKTSTTNFIVFQSDSKDHVKGEYEFQNTLNETRIIIKLMADYSAMKFYLK